MNKVIFEQEVPVHKENGDYFIFKDCTGEKKEVTVGSITAFKSIRGDGETVAFVKKLSYYDLYVNGCVQGSYVRVKLVTISDDNTTSKYKYDTGENITIDFPIIDNVATNKLLKIFILNKNFFKEKLNEQS